MSLEPLRFGRLKQMAKSPAHYLAAADGPGSSALAKGRAVHSVLLGGAPVTYYDRVTESGRSAPRNGKHWEQFQADNLGAIVLSRDEYFQTNEMAKAVRACPEAMRVLQGNEEHTVYWDVMGRACRGTPDVDGGSFVTELKTTRSSDPRRFMWDALRMHYNGQLAWYMDGLAMQRGRREMPEAAFIVAVESAAPYAVTVFRVPERALDAGRKANRLWLERVLVCEASGEFPGYSQSVVDLGFPEDEPELVFSDAEAA